MSSVELRERFWKGVESAGEGAFSLYLATVPRNSQDRVVAVSACALTAIAVVGWGWAVGTAVGVVSGASYLGLREYTVYRPSLFQGRPFTEAENAKIESLKNNQRINAIALSWALNEKTREWDPVYVTEDPDREGFVIHNFDDVFLGSVKYRNERFASEPIDIFNLYVKSFQTMHGVKYKYVGYLLLKMVQEKHPGRKVVLNSVHTAIEFYEKLGLRKIPLAEFDAQTQKHLKYKNLTPMHMTERMRARWATFSLFDYTPFDANRTDSVE